MFRSTEQNITLPCSYLSAATLTAFRYFPTHRAYVVHRFNTLFPRLHIVVIQINGRGFCRVNHPLKRCRLVNPFVNDAKHINHIFHIHALIFLVKPKVFLGKLWCHRHHRRDAVCFHKQALVDGKQTRSGSHNTGCRGVWCGSEMI